MQDKEKRLGRIIYKILPIEWIRYNMYTEEDVYRNVPMLVFRVRDICDNQKLDALQSLVSEFDGNIKWKMFKDPLSRKGNYLITIDELEVMHLKYYDNNFLYDQKQYFGTNKYKKICEMMIEDIPELSMYIERNMK